MCPQTYTVLTHLLNHGSLTAVEAAAVYKVRSLSKRISEIKQAGYGIKRTLHKDATGQRYAKYDLA